jgi:hypothetical protein
MIFSFMRVSVDPPEPPTKRVVCATAAPANKATAAALITGKYLDICASEEVNSEPAMQGTLNADSIES